MEDGFKCVNCTNYFNDIGKQRLKEALEAGETVHIYIDCIGHTRAYWEEKWYREWLVEFYGDKLEIGHCYLGDTFKLRAG